jgi:ATP-dependent DNA ligase
VEEAPAGGGWLHEIKYDGYRMHARIDGRDIKLLTRTGLDWSHPYKRMIEALGSLNPEGSRSHIGALLLGYYTEDGRLHYAGRAGTGMTEKELKRLAAVLAPLQVAKMPLVKPPPRDSRFGSPLKLWRVNWVRPELVVEVTYLTWTEDNLLRQVSYQGQREDKPARQVVRQVPMHDIRRISPARG